MLHLTAKQKRVIALLIVWLLLLALFFGLWLANKPQSKTKAIIVYTRYKDFGVSIPKPYTVAGVDVSRYQSAIRWPWLKAFRSDKYKIEFIFIKATQGSTGIDPYYKMNSDSAAHYNIRKGAYHYFNPNERGAVQAMHFIRTVTLAKQDLPPVLDIEELPLMNLYDLETELQIFLKMVEASFGKKPIIYTNAQFYKDHLKKFKDYPLWVAHYTKQQQPAIDRDWVFWQISDRAHVSGISSPVDLNVFVGDTLQLSRLVK